MSNSKGNRAQREQRAIKADIDASGVELSKHFVGPVVELQSEAAVIAAHDADAIALGQRSRAALEDQFAAAMTQASAQMPATPAFDLAAIEEQSAKEAQRLLEAELLAHENPRLASLKGVSRILIETTGHTPAGETAQPENDTDVGPHRRPASGSRKGRPYEDSRKLEADRQAIEERGKLKDRAIGLSFD